MTIIVNTPHHLVIFPWTDDSTLGICSITLEYLCYVKVRKWLTGDSRYTSRISLILRTQDSEVSVIVYLHQFFVINILDTNSPTSRVRLAYPCPRKHC